MDCAIDSVRVLHSYGTTAISKPTTCVHDWPIIQNATIPHAATPARPGESNILCGASQARRKSRASSRRLELRPTWKKQDLFKRPHFGHRHFRSTSQKNTKNEAHSYQYRHAHADWKTFCTDCFLIFPAASSSPSTSSGDNCQPSAPKFSLACAKVLTPTIGTVPLQTHQFRATCDMVLPRASEISCITASNGPIVGNTRRKIIPRGPEGMLPELYFPVKSPSPSGE